MAKTAGISSSSSEGKLQADVKEVYCFAVTKQK
jgi:hypothetical protein